jgi:hypothetical protein
MIYNIKINYKNNIRIERFPRVNIKKNWKIDIENFITESPLSLRNRRVFNAILAVVNRYSKIAYFILITIDIDVPAFAEFIYDEMMKYHGIFKLIIWDREFIFIFKWWSSFCHY